MAKIAKFKLEGDALVLVGYLDERHMPTFAVGFKADYKIKNMSRAELAAFKQALLHDVYDVLFDSTAERFLVEWGEEPMQVESP
jgi:hypothetical protein